MKDTDDVCLFVFASIAPNQVNTETVMMAEITGTRMPVRQTENMVFGVFCYSTENILRTRSLEVR